VPARRAPGGGAPAAQLRGRRRPRHGEVQVPRGHHVPLHGVQVVGGVVRGAALQGGDQGGPGAGAGGRGGHGRRRRQHGAGLKATALNETS